VVNVATGSVVEEIDYDEFGNVTGDTAPGLTPFGFAGGLYDGDTGLVRFGARDYDARVGRWTSKDPKRFGGEQINFYVYVGNDPVNRHDPTGRDWSDTLPWLAFPTIMAPEVLIPIGICLATSMLLDSDNSANDNAKPVPSDDTMCTCLCVWHDGAGNKMNSHFGKKFYGDCSETCSAYDGFYCY
jgi:RHS repeat-associated protein